MILKRRSIAGLCCACLFLALFPSCATVMSSGVDGGEAPMLPPFHTEGSKTSDVAVSAQAGASTMTSLLFPFVLGSGTTEFAKGDVIYQWQPKPGTMGFCGAAALGGWGAFSTDPLSSGGYRNFESDAFSYGAYASIRLGLMVSQDSNVVYTPSLQFLYAYEGGPYFDKRAALAALKPASSTDMLYLNMKTDRLSWIASLSPLDVSIKSSLGDIRYAIDLGWNDRWYPVLSSVWPELWSDPENRGRAVLAAAFPTNIYRRIALRFPNTGWYIGIDSMVTFNLMGFISMGAAVGAGYAW